jgi:hypothetical protein
MLSWSWRSIKLLLLHLAGVPYYFTYNDDARPHKNQVYGASSFVCLYKVFWSAYIPTWNP